MVRAGSAAACRLLDANGARVAVHGRDEARIAAVVDEIDSNGGQAIGVSAEVTDFAAIERMRERGGGAGRWMCWPYLPPAVALPGPTVEIAEEEWRDGVEGNPPPLS